MVYLDIKDKMVRASLKPLITTSVLLYLSTKIYKFDRDIFKIYIVLILIKCRKSLKIIFHILKYLLCKNIMSVSDTDLYNFSNTILKDQFNLKIIGEENLNTEHDNKGTIFIANYPHNALEYVLHKYIDSEKIVVNEKAFRTTKLLIPKENIICVKSKNSYDFLKSEIEQIVNRKKNVFLYCENKYKLTNDIENNELRSGAFYIAKELNCSITPVFLSYITSDYGFFNNEPLILNVHPPIYNVENTEYVKKHVRTFFRKNKFRFKIDN